jgi:dTMP kinase
MRGRFITLEGIEGVGKSTQVTRAAAHLRARGIDPVVTREPGGTPLAEQLRRLVLEPQDGPVGPSTELLLIFAARADHVANVIRPALRQGRWVLCDRFTDATVAYQGAGSGMNEYWIRQLARIAHPRLEPDLTLLLDAPPAVTMARLSGRGRRADRFESEDAAFFERVRRRYLAIAAAEPGRVRVIDAAAGEAEVAHAIARAIDQVLPAGRSRGP